MPSSSQGLATCSHALTHTAFMFAVLALLTNAARVHTSLYL
jgi:hypothetical protein